MLRWSLSYKMLVRLAGIVLLLYGLYWVVLALFTQVDQGGAVQYHGPLLFWDATPIRDYIFFGYPLPDNPALGGWFAGRVMPGPLLYASLGLCLLTLSTLRPRLAYWSLQVVLWLGSMSCWGSLALMFDQHGSGQVIPDSITPFFWITLACSLVLLGLYQPVLAGLKKLCLPATMSPPGQDGPTRSEAA